MVENKISVIVYATAASSIDAVKSMLESLNIPQGFIPTAHIVGGENRWYAYEQAMKSNDAKYKIYIDDKVVCLNKNILSDTIEIFRSDQNIGMIGCAGAIEMPANGNPYTASKRCGKMLVGSKKNYLDGQDINGRFQEVEVINGFMLATQYDIDWRADLFNKNSFGDAAQSLEFRRRGYKCVVARQEQPWLWYLGEIVPYHEPMREVFLNEYSKDLYPLVQILIPTFNRPQFFPVALESAINQTYRNIEIVVSDDSTNEKTYSVVQPYLAKDKRIQYFRNAGFTGADNFNFLNDKKKARPEAEYFNWLFDDDMFYPTKIEKMIDAYRNNPDVSIVTSRRHNIDSAGKVLGEMEPLYNRTGKLSGEEIGKFMLMYTANRIGEPSTVLLKKSFVANEEKDHWRRRPNMIDKPNSIGDYSEWLYLLERGNIFWINEVLSARRVHPGQDSQNIATWVQIYINFAEEVAEYWSRKKFLTTEAELRHAIIIWLTKGAGALQQAFLQNYSGRETKMIERVIVAMTQALYNGGNIKMPSWSKIDRKGRAN